MRKDVVVDKIGKLYCNQIPFGSAGRPCYVERGDFVEWQEFNNTCRGRVVGVIKNPDDDKSYFCVVMMMLSGYLCERWILPEWVVNTSHGSSVSSVFGGKAKWFFGEEFLNTSTDNARQVRFLTSEELLEGTNDTLGPCT